MRNSHTEKLQQLIERISQLAALQFPEPLELIGDGSDLDAIVLGFNMLSEELEHSVVSKSSLEKSEAEFRSLYEQSQMGVAFIDTNGCFLNFNLNFQNFFNMKLSDVTGRSMLYIFNDVEDEQFVFLFSQLLSGKIERFQLEIKHKCEPDQFVFFVASFSTIKSKNGERLYYIVTILDMNETKRLQQALIESAKMSALGEMASGVAHEINNPLGIIQAKANQLLKKAQKNTLTTEILKSELEKIVNTTLRIERIIKGLRSYARSSEKDPFESTKLSNIVQNVIELSSEKLKSSNIRFDVDIIPDIEIECRLAQIEQVLLNLISNSHDAVEKLEDKWIRLEFRILDLKVQFILIDSGHGISKHLIDKIMQPFFTTKEVGKGTGLGLSISKGLIADHGGKIEYDQHSKNTKFVMTLPFRQST